MYLSHTVSSRPMWKRFAAGLAALLLTVAPAFAQRPFSHVTRGWETTQALMNYHQSPRSLPPAQVPSWAQPNVVQQPRFVGIRDANGQIRYYEIEAPIEVVPKFRPGVVTHYPRQ